eukprot:SAG31_NODE_37880_length_300_cov_1.278607_1_plen_56_part_10
MGPPGYLVLAVRTKFSTYGRTVYGCAYARTVSDSVARGDTARLSVYPTEFKFSMRC